MFLTTSMEYWYVEPRTPANRFSSISAISSPS